MKRNPKKHDIPEEELQNNPYSVLGIEKGASDAEIKRAYLELVRKYPPERHQEEFKKVRAAYETLKDKSERVRLDLFHFNLDERSLLGETQDVKLDLGLSLAETLRDIIRWTSDLARKEFPGDLQEPDFEEVRKAIER